MKEQAKILVIEDDSTIRTLLEMALMGAGYSNVRSSARGDDGVALARSFEPDLVLLDIMLPGLDGFSVCSRLREVSETASARVIMLTARGQKADILRGLELGADDYIVKPFDRELLLARIAAVLRRGLPATDGVDYDGLVIDEATRTAKLDGGEIELTSGEFDLLIRLVDHRGRILARPPDERTMDVQVANLRRKLGRWSSHVETIRGVGYRVSV